MADPILFSQSYGKSQVRLSRVMRDGPRHEFHDLTLSIALEGGFEAAYSEANCSSLIATDTMKNTVYVLASRHGIRSAEEFARRLAQHFLDEYGHVEQVSVACQEQPWQRVEAAGRPHDHAFLGSTTERHTCHVVARRGETASLLSGLVGLRVLKTTRSAFRGFLRDQYTTLPETTDRILATTIEASWPCGQLDADWPRIRQTVRDTLITVFADHDSQSVQHTMYDMARGVFAACDAIDEISLRLPNEHHLLANLAPFGLANPNEVFIPTSEPFGDIRATLRRGETGPTRGVLEQKS